MALKFGYSCTVGAHEHLDRLILGKSFLILNRKGSEVVVIAGGKDDLSRRLSVKALSGILPSISTMRISFLVGTGSRLNKL